MTNNQINDKEEEEEEEELLWQTPVVETPVKGCTLTECQLNIARTAVNR